MQHPCSLDSLVEEIAETRHLLPSLFPVHEEEAKNITVCYIYTLYAKYSENSNIICILSLHKFITSASQK